MLYRCTFIYILRGCMTIYFENRKNAYLFLHIKSQVLEDRTDRPPLTTLNEPLGLNSFFVIELSFYDINLILL